MKLMGLNILSKYQQKHKDVQSCIEAWVAETKDAVWQSFKEVKDRYASASYILKNNIIFNFKGNEYRLWIKINFKTKTIEIINIGTHREYDRWKIE